VNWEQKLEALNKLEECRLQMRQPGDWIVHQHVEIKDYHLMISHFGQGTTPEAAVEDHWTHLTEKLKGHQFLVARSGRPSRIAARWNGFMWAPVDEREQMRPQPARA
jgi:hypothetical protein